MARRVGLQPPQVRQAYLAYATLHYGADQLGMNVDGILDHAKRRFGVWLRAMESPGVRSFVGVGSPTDYEEVQKALKKLTAHKAQLKEVIADIGPPQGDPVLEDSRQVTVYARILAHAEALRVKRDEKRLDTAKEIVGRESLVGRVAKVEKTLDAMAREVSAFEVPPTEELVSGVEFLRRAAVRLSGAVKEIASGHNE